MPQLEIQIAVAKVGKYATSESGDTVEMVERPQGGLSVVVVDGQRSGKAAKSISNIVARKAISLLAEGVRDGAVARAAHDYLRTMRSGKVSATLNIVSIDLQTETIVLSRNSHCPVVVCAKGEIYLLDQPSESVGIRTWTKPVITELPIISDTFVIAFTDGVIHAGARYGQEMDISQLARSLLPGTLMSVQGIAKSIADEILAKAIASDRGRPDDDISVLVMAVLPSLSDGDDVRRMSVYLPIRVHRVADDAE
jgi:serine phosphatase RsbU (regulator of sigma subunit)